VSVPIEMLRRSLADRYRVEEEIGHGGMAVVFRARDLRLDREVAVKVLDADVSATLAHQRFHREVSLAAKLQHPNIVPLFDSGEADGLFYYVMPLIEGESLRDRLKTEGQLPLDEALRIADDVADGLSFAHARGIVHRDVKPSNILLSGGRALVADFGIARAMHVAGGSELTSSGILLGTPTYMSPEQASGESELDARSDVYALGCVLYEMLAGEPPFGGPTPQVVIARQVAATAPSLALVRPDLPPAVFQTVGRALAKAKVDRFPSAEAFKAALHGTSGSRVGAGTLGWSRWALGAVAAILLALVFVVLRPPPAPPLDENRIVVFPFVERGGAVLPAGTGELVALAIGSAFEHAEPLRWIDGWLWVDERARRDPLTLTAQVADSIARSQRARYRLDGFVAARGDSASVILTLYDVAEARQIAQHTEVGRPVQDSLVQLGIRAAMRALPDMVGAGVDVTPLLDRHPSAVALFLLGERAYRQSRFSEALVHYEAALDADSALAPAALNGAPAASWLDQTARARALLDRGMAGAGLSDLQRVFARGLRAYLDGEADTAVAYLRRAVEADPTRPDAWMALGEVHRHLLPRGSTDSLRMQAFEAAVRADPGFAPARFHLAEAALWRGDPRGAEEHAVHLSRTGADVGLVRRMRLMIDCARDGPDPAPWSEAAREDPELAIDAAYALTPSVVLWPCAETGFRAVWAAPDVAFLPRWAALLALNNLEVARGRAESALALVDTALAAGIGVAGGLPVLDAIAGVDTRARAQAVVDGLGTDYANRGAQGLWLMGTWEALRGDTERVRAIATELERRASGSGARTDRLWAEVIGARLDALDGRTEQAVARLAGLRPDATRPDIAWSMWEGLGYERLEEARLLIELGEYARAEAVAAELDHPAPIMYVALRPESLRLRARAARLRGDDAGATRYESRVDEFTQRNRGGTRP
jgi:tetratricopeptide (TPR) repeat protein